MYEYAACSSLQVIARRQRPKKHLDQLFSVAKCQITFNCILLASTYAIQRLNQSKGHNLATLAACNQVCHMDYYLFASELLQKISLHCICSHQTKTNQPTYPRLPIAGILPAHAYDSSGCRSTACSSLNRRCRAVNTIRLCLFR
jgi:hypothetical protein